jgi:hypothetical protein
LYELTGRYADAAPLHQRIVAMQEKPLRPGKYPTELTKLASAYLRIMADDEKAARSGFAANSLVSLYKRMDRYADAERLSTRQLTSGRVRQSCPAVSGHW